jgi:endonuclease/exonuclease/phosphatase family metal-dependent hydrolase
MASRVKLGTFNINNLFDRFDDPYNKEDTAYRLHQRYRQPLELINIWRRAQLIMAQQPDVLAIQEVEGRGALWEFNASHLGNYFRHLALIEGNDFRGIDVAVVSRLPIGQVTSHQFRHHPESTTDDGTVFSRDLLEIEILHRQRTRVLFTLFVSHLKSKYMDPRYQGAAREAKEQRNNSLRRLQAQTIVDIVQERFLGQPDAMFAIAGDFNDSPDSKPLQPLAALGCRDVLDTVPMADRWTIRFQRRKYQFDYILLSPALHSKMVPGSAFVDQKTGMTGASDHRPVYVELEI